MSSPSDDPPPDRRARRKFETRARLLAAARELMAQQGAEVTRINEITEAADVGFGSFYNHFESKDAIVAAVAEAVAAELGETIAATTADFADAAEVLAVAHRTIVRQAAADPTIGWLMVRLELSHDLVSTALGPYALRDLQRGIDDGRFTVTDPAATLVAMGGALLATVRGVLQGRLGADADRGLAVATLQMAGLTASDAAAVAQRPMPEVQVAGRAAPSLGDAAA